jgi:hypothetical protein
MELSKFKGVLMRRIESCLAFPGFEINGNIYCKFFGSFLIFTAKAFLMLRWVMKL